MHNEWAWRLGRFLLSPNRFLSRNRRSMGEKRIFIAFNIVGSLFFHRNVSLLTKRFQSTFKKSQTAWLGSSFYINSCLVCCLVWINWSSINCSCLISSQLFVAFCDVQSFGFHLGILLATCFFVFYRSVSISGISLSCACVSFNLLFVLVWKCFISICDWIFCDCLELKWCSSSIRSPLDSCQRLKKVHLTRNTRQSWEMLVSYA